MQNTAPPQIQILKATQNIYNTIKTNFPEAVGSFERNLCKQLYQNLVEIPTPNKKGTTPPENNVANIYIGRASIMLSLWRHEEQRIRMCNTKSIPCALKAW
uniref:Uncharacterized protein n=1 Tax=Octopus bimaculoides TaxID=37653 RepID=A0A0L8H025_OCTBM